MKKTNNIIKIEGRLNRILFPKYPTVLGKGEDTFGIVSWYPMLVLEGEPATDNWGGLVIKGTYEEEIDPSKDYTIIAKEVDDEKRGKQYELMFIGQLINLSNVTNQKAFLKTFLTDLQISEMFKVLDNPLKVIEDHDINSLKRVSGVGDYIANCIVDRFEDNKDNCEVYLELDEYGLTPKFIQKLIKKYKNPHTVIDIVKTNPYKLSFDIDGIGFKTADAIALKSGISETSPERVKGYINFILNDLGQSGNSYITSGELTGYIFDEFGGKENILEVYTDEDGDITGNNIGQAIEELTEKGIIILEELENKSNRKVYLKEYYDLENEISGHLKRIASSKNKFEYENWEKVVAEQEQKQGWKFTDEQKNGIEATIQNQLMFITGGAGCVDCDTEFFNGYGWKKISDYEKGDKVLQYNKNGVAELVYPLRYIKEKELYLNYIRNKSDSVNQMLCDEHNVYYQNSAGQDKIIKAKEMKEKHNKSKLGFSGRFLTTFKYSGSGINLSDEEIRVMVAVIADGNFSENNDYCRINIKKSRKQERIEYLLDKASIKYLKKSGDKEGYFKYYFHAPLTDKEYLSHWYNATKHQLEIIIGEVIKWDGSVRYNDATPYSAFSSVSKKSIDFIQFAFASCGIRTSITIQDRRGQEYGADNLYQRKSVEYTLNISSKAKKVGIQARRPEDKINIEQYKTKDGYKYCFTVPSHLLVLRRKGRIFITGNCGKTSVLGGVLNVLGCYDNKHTFAQCSLSGKAAARMAEVTGKEGYTIHRLLGFQPPNGFNFNEENPLEYDIIVLDEISLVGGEIFLSLIKAIPDGCKLIILGDMGQLESIGCMNLAHDIYDSNYITTIELTKIHRQAQKSGIITASQSIRNGDPIFDKKFVGFETMGELQDMHFDITDTSSATREMVVKHFIEKYNGRLVKNEIMDIQILATCKERGNSSVFNLNQDIQNYLNPAEAFKQEIKVQLGKDKEFFLREGDKVMCIKNNYKLFNIEGTKTPVFNGWVGILKTINVHTNIVEIFFPIINDTICFTTAEVSSSVILGYASTTHKYQGSSAKCIVGVLDSSVPPDMLTKELLYTMITRAEDECIIVAQNAALHKAVLQSGISDKNTFLTELLDFEEKGEVINK